jgi:hypothetical protein
MTIPPRAFDNFDWKIIPGRKVCHAIKEVYPRSLGNSRYRGFCGVTDYYPKELLLESTKDTLQCEQCLIRLVSLKEDDFNYKRAWRKFLTENPEYGPATWRDHSLGRKL